jgi:hypothetical protein
MVGMWDRTASMGLLAASCEKCPGDKDATKGDEGEKDAKQDLIN